MFIYFLAFVLNAQDVTFLCVKAHTTYSLWPICLGLPDLNVIECGHVVFYISV